MGRTVMIEVDQEGLRRQCERLEERAEKGFVSRARSTLVHSRLVRRENSCIVFDAFRRSNRRLSSSTNSTEFQRKTNILLKHL